MIEPRTKDFILEGIPLVIDWLMYRSYEFNRDRSPHVEAERWRAIYLSADTFEKIYQERIPK
jgi:hypothetical protein